MEDHGGEPVDGLTDGEIAARLRQLEMQRQVKWRDARAATAAMIEYVQRLIEHGYSVPWIAEECGLSRFAVHRMLGRREERK